MEEMDEISLFCHFEHLLFEPSLNIKYMDKFLLYLSLPRDLKTRQNFASWSPELSNIFTFWDVRTSH